MENGFLANFHGYLITIKVPISMFPIRQSFQGLPHVLACSDSRR